jgi:hypothetical protein
LIKKIFLRRQTIAEKYTQRLFNPLEGNAVYSIKGLNLPRHKVVDCTILRVLARSIKRQTSFLDLFCLVKKFNGMVEEQRRVLRLKAVTQFYKSVVVDELTEDEDQKDHQPDLGMFSVELGKRVCGWARV